MSLRRLRVLVENLPPNSASERARKGHHWTDVEYLLAEAADAGRVQAANYYNAHKPKTARPAKVDPLPRPGESKAERERDMRDRLLEQRARHQRRRQRLRSATS